MPRKKKVNPEVKEAIDAMVELVKEDIAKTQQKAPVSSVEEAFERAIQTAKEPEPPADPFVSVVANGSFHDGAFKHDFEKLGYKVHWKDREVRQIPARLYAKLMKRSGGKFALKG